MTPRCEPPNRACAWRAGTDQRGEPHDRDDEQQQARERRVGGEHQDQREREGHQLAHQQAEAAQQLEEHLDVVGDPRHHASDRDLVVEGRGEALEVREEIAPQVAQRAERGARQQHAVDVAEAAPGDHEPGVQQAGGDRAVGPR